MALHRVHKVSRHVLCLNCDIMLYAQKLHKWTLRHALSIMPIFLR